MKRMSIRWKLTFLYGGVLAIVLALFAAILLAVISHQMLRRVDQGLEEELADVLHEIHRAESKADLDLWLNRRFARHEGFDFQILNPNGERVFVSERLGQRSLPRPKVVTSHETFDTLALEDGRYRLVCTETPGGELGAFLVQIARSLDGYDRELGDLRLVFAVVTPLTLLLASGAGYVLARRVLQPVQRMAETARDIGAGRLDRRLDVPNPDDELGVLGATLNDMIGRLESSVKEMQRFTADAAHELRTPLAVLRNETEVALRAPRSNDDYRCVLETLLEEFDRLGQMADQLLFLCRQDAGLQPKVRNPFRTDALVAEIFGQMQLVATEKGVQFRLDANALGEFQGDLVQLRRLLYNLLDNAIKYTPTGGVVAIRSEIGNQVWTLSVVDSGVGIAPDHLPHVFDRFYRVDPARNAEAGVGLGLSICQSIIRGMDGRITIDSELGRGTQVIISLPTHL